jgi:hypothetical protein
VNLRNLIWPAVLMAVLLGLGGCRALPPAPPPPAVASAEELLIRLRSRHRQVNSFEAKGRLTFLSPERNYSGTGLIKGRLPTTLRVDILDFFGRSLLSFATDGQEVQVLAPKEGKLYRGQATPKNLAAFIPPVMSVPQALSLLMGDLPLSPGSPSQWKYEAAKGQYLLEWRQGDGSPRERLWVEAYQLYPVKEEWFGADGQALFTADLADYGQSPASFPGRLTLRTYTPKAELRVHYQEVRLNPGLAAADLVLTTPPTVTVVPLAP